MTLRHALLSNTGTTRNINEDAVRIIEMNAADGASGQSLLLAIVADGMGGHAAGEVASQTAVSVFANTVLSRLDPPSAISEADIIETVAAGFTEANSSVYHLGRQDSAKQGMGTTLTVALFFNGAVCVGHVGDSRAYLLRGGAIQRLTHDHTLAREKLDAGLLTAEEAAYSEERHVLRRVVGTRSTVQPDIIVNTVNGGDTFMLCTDGLYGSFTDAELSHAARDADLAGISEKLVVEAITRDGSDNISLVCVSVPKHQPTRRRGRTASDSSSSRDAPRRIIPIALLGLVLVMMFAISLNLWQQTRTAPLPTGQRRTGSREAPTPVGQALIDLTITLKDKKIDILFRGSRVYTVSVAGTMVVPAGGRAFLTLPQRFYPTPAQRVGFSLTAESVRSIQWKLSRSPAILPTKNGLWIDERRARVMEIGDITLSTPSGAGRGRVSSGKTATPARQIKFYLAANTSIPVIIDLAASGNNTTAFTSKQQPVTNTSTDQIASSSEVKVNREPEKRPPSADRPEYTIKTNVNGMTGKHETDDKAMKSAAGDSGNGKSDVDAMVNNNSAGAEQFPGAKISDIAITPGTISPPDQSK